MNLLDYLILIPLGTIFLRLNYKIILSDIKYKKIPNKYLLFLLYLLPIWYVFLFLNFDINLVSFLTQLILWIVVSFVLFYFWIWAAGDAKYLLVLFLFIPHIGIVPFIWNIAMVVLTYLFLYFVYFYLIKILFNKNYRQGLWYNIKIDLQEKWNIYKQNKWWNTVKIILKWLVVFLLIFVSIRLVRIYLFNWLFSSENWFNRIEQIKYFLVKYNVYVILIAILAFFWIMYLIHIYVQKLKAFLARKFKININRVWNILLIALAIFLISFISYEYFKNPYEIKLYLVRILTLYLAIYILVKILIFAYKVTFWIWEYNYIDINELKEWDIVDKQYLIKLFGEQAVLWYASSKQERKARKKYLLFPSPKDYFLQIDNPIDKETVKILKKVYHIVNNYQKKYIPHYQPITDIKVINTFAFSPYIFSGFLITLILQDKIYQVITNYLINLIQYRTH